MEFGRDRPMPHLTGIRSHFFTRRNPDFYFY